VPLELLKFHSFTREPGSLGQDKDTNRAFEEKESVRQQIKVVRVTLKAPARPDRRLSDTTVTVLLATEPNPHWPST
jgi:hypothetical protein